MKPEQLSTIRDIQANTGSTGPASTAIAVMARRLLDDVRRKCGIRHDRPLERKLERILASMPLDRLEQWVRVIEAAPPESPDWLSFIENLTIHETYFFRDIPHHQHLRRTVLPALIDARRGRGERTLRIWSAGCATGEEAYSLAILVLETLADMGEAERPGLGIRTGWSVEVLGTDLSRLAVAQARNACYGGEGLGPFRDLPGEYAGWFVPLEGMEATYHRVRGEARSLVSLRQHNLMSPQPPDAGFDLVSCRNVLIYFGDDTRRTAQRLLTKALAPRGVLVLGTTDTLCEPARFEKLRGDRAAAYRLKDAA